MNYIEADQRLSKRLLGVVDVRTNRQAARNDRELLARADWVVAGQIEGLTPRQAAISATYTSQLKLAKG